ncbi:MAG: hypothetical protein NC828_04180, partial [Candidatus Omnitrophica bacterium]|nr:hypothetical protein [Candidatus Omnitrophota bacterium]
IKQERDSSYFILQKTSAIINAMLEIFRSDELYLEGISSLLTQPEFEDAKIAKSIVEILENKSMLLELIEKDLESDGMRIYIGRENSCPYMRRCSILTSGYKVKDELSGRLGIIGPTRMAYDHLIPLVNYVSETLSKTLGELIECHYEPE